MSGLLEAAVAYAERGWPVLPLRRGEKVPEPRFAPKGLHSATTDPALVRSWWEERPHLNIGLRTGVAFDVLDIDGPDALEGLEAVERPEEAPTIDGPSVVSPRGFHAYVAPTGRGNTVRMGGLDGIDWRGRNGYIVAPPSVRRDGASWTWAPAPFDRDAAILPAPAWLLELLSRRDRPASHRDAEAGGSSSYGRAALEREVGRLLLAEVGSRNNQLNRSAHALGQLVAGGELDLGEVIRALADSARRAGLDEEEIGKTLESGLRSGLRSPRKVVHR